MSDTPRSDDFIGPITGIYMTEGEIAMCDFARQLERELNAAKQELQDAVKRLSEVTDEAIESAYWSSWTSTQIVRNLFIQAAKGEQL